MQQNKKQKKREDDVWNCTCIFKERNVAADDTGAQGERFKSCLCSLHVEKSGVKMEGFCFRPPVLNCALEPFGSVDLC